jgi:hypothetical protein
MFWKRAKTRAPARLSTDDAVFDRIEAARRDDPEAEVALDGPAGGSEIRFAPGLADARFAEPDSSPHQIGSRAAARAFGAAVRRFDGESIAHLDQVLAETNAIAIVDDFLARVSATALDRARAAEVARELARRSAHVETVKLGMALLGVYGTPRDIPLLKALARFDELTLYGVVATRSINPAPERDLYEMARAVRGWGRVRAIEALESAEDAEVRDWLLREGHAFGFLAEEIALCCARSGRLHEALAGETADEALLDGAAELIGTLLLYGQDIYNYPEGEQAVRSFLRHAAASRRLSLVRFTTAQALRDFADQARADPARRTRLGWPLETFWQIRTSAGPYLARKGWKRAVEKALAEDNDVRFAQGCQVGEALAMDIWPRRFARQRTRTGTGQWYWLMQTDDGERIAAVLALAREQLDLKRLGAGPGTELGLGPDFAQDRALDFILQDLRRFPRRGWDLVKTGLANRTIRARHMALRTLLAWGPDAWPDDAAPALERALEREPDDKVRAQIEEALRSARDRVPAH